MELGRDGRSTMIDQSMQHPCIYCGATKDLDSDHVPPKSVFPPPRPSDLITVPSCRACNKGFQKDDEYFKVSLTLRQDIQHRPAAKILMEGLRRSWERPEGRAFTRYLQNRIHFFETPPELKAVGVQYSAQLTDGPRLNRAVARTVQGLFYHEHKRPLRADYRACGLVYELLRAEQRHMLDIMLRGTEPRSIAGGDFMYASNCHATDADSTVWLLLFYGGAGFVGTTGPAPGVVAA